MENLPQFTRRSLGVNTIYSSERGGTTEDHLTASAHTFKATTATTVRKGENRVKEQYCQMWDKFCDHLWCDFAPTDGTTCPHQTTVEIKEDKPETYCGLDGAICQSDFCQNAPCEHQVTKED